MADGPNLRRASRARCERIVGWNRAVCLDAEHAASVIKGVLGAVRLAAIAAAPAWGDAAVRLLRERARRDRMQLQRMALDGLGRVGTVAAADALYEMASEKLLLNEMVEHAWAVLAREFPEYLASRGGLPDYLANKGGLCLLYTSPSPRDDT